MSRTALLVLSLAACSGSNAAPPPVAGDASVLDTPSADTPSADALIATDASDDAGASPDLTGDYTGVDCTRVEAVSFNDGGVRVTEVCDLGRASSARFVTLRACAEGLTSDAALVRRIADDGAYMTPSRHPHEGSLPCSRFVTLYPVEQVRHALWCLRNAARCNDDGSLR